MCNLKLLVGGAVFSSNSNLMGIAYYLNSGDSRGGFERGRVKTLHEFEFEFEPAKLNESIETRITCKKPHQFHPQGPFSFTVRDLIERRTVIYHTQLKSDSEKEQSIPLCLEVFLSGISAGKFDIVYPWIPETTKAGTSQTGTDEEGVAAAKFGEQSETSICIELAAKEEFSGNLTYVAKSYSTGKELSIESSDGRAVLDSIEPGDGYRVFVYDGDGSNGACIGKSEIQTSKTITKKGGPVTVGNCQLDFPSDAIHDQSRIEVPPFLKNPPPPPNNSMFVTPVMDFRSTQNKFSKHVTCKLFLPYVNIHEAVEVDIMFFENLEWQKVCSTHLTETKMLEFECNHFSLYAVVVWLSFAVAQYIPISYELVNYVYYDKQDNFVVVTCLNLPKIIALMETKVSQYVKSAHVIYPNVKLRFGDEAIGYTLKRCEPLQIIGRWQVTLNEEFVNDGNWIDLQQLHMDKPADDTTQIQVSLKRVRGGNAKECVINMDYPLAKNIPAPAAVKNKIIKVYQGGQVISSDNCPTNATAKYFNAPGAEQNVRENDTRSAVLTETTVNTMWRPSITSVKTRNSMSKNTTPVVPLQETQDSRNLEDGVFSFDSSTADARVAGLNKMF